MKKKILAGMLVFAMVCSLGACSGEKSNPKDTKEGKEGILEQEVGTTTVITSDYSG